MDRRLLSDRIDDRGADLRPPWRRFRPAQPDVRGARRFHRRLAVVRHLAHDRTIDARPPVARARRWRADDAVASAGRRSHPAARTGALPGLSRRRRGLRQYLRTGGRRLSVRALRLAVDLPDQRSGRARRGRADLAAADPRGRTPRLARRPGRAFPVHAVRCHHAVVARADPARRTLKLAARGCAAGRRHRRARFSDSPRETGAVAAHSARTVAHAGDLAQRRLGRLPWRRAGVADHLPAGLSGSGAGRIAVEHRPAAGAAHHRHRHGVAADRTAGQQNRLHHAVSRHRPGIRHR